jgi:DNA polymerase elongation subunit (family B)
MRKRREVGRSETETTTRGAEPQAYVNAVWQGNKIALLWRDEQGELCKREVNAEHCCHLRLSDWTPELERVCRSFKGIRGFKIEGDWVRLTFVDRDTCRTICGQGGYFEKHSIPNFEADLHPVRRWFVEHPNVGIQKPIRGYLDLETDSRVPFSEKENARILMWALLNHETGRVVQGVLEEDTDEAEIELLADLWYELQSVDQVAVWAGGVQGAGMFDTDVLFARTKLYIDKLRVFPSRWLWISHLEAYKKMNMSASASGEEKQSMALNKVAESLGIEGKDDFDAGKIYEAWEAGGEELVRACRYNVRDVRIMHEIELKKPYLDMLYSVCAACGTFPDQRGINGTAYVESFILRLAQSRNIHFRSHWRYDSSGKFEGAFVLPPKKLGVMRNVHVCDFASLYPSIIQTWNLSLETHAPEHKLIKEMAWPSYLAHVPPVIQPIPPNHARAPNTGETFRLDVEGILPISVTELRRLRAYYSKKAAEYPPGTPEHQFFKNLSDGYKICNNTFYGVIGSPFSRFYKREVAESTSTTGAWLIKEVMKEAERRGWTLQSGDTDSAFIMGCSQAEFQEFVTWLNEVKIPELVKGQGCTRNEIKLEAEKGFDVLVYTAKKRYAGRFAYYKGKPAVADSKPEIKGLEYKRGDAVRLAREMQLEVVEKLICKELFPVPEVLPYTAHDFVTVVERWRDRVLKEKLDRDDYVKSQTLTGALNSYAVKKKKDGEDAAQPVHVEVAKKMKADGLNVSEGTRIEYVIVDGSTSPQKAVPIHQFHDGDEDRHYLWEVQVWPPTYRVLEACFPEIPWERYNRTRPYKGKNPKRGGAGEGQLGMLGAESIPVARGPRVVG